MNECSLWMFFINECFFYEWMFSCVYEWISLWKNVFMKECFYEWKYRISRFLRLVWPTDGQTNRLMDMTSFKDDRTHLKNGYEKETKSLFANHFQIRFRMVGWISRKDYRWRNEPEANQQLCNQSVCLQKMKSNSMKVLISECRTDHSFSWTPSKPGLWIACPRTSASLSFIHLFIHSFNKNVHSLILNQRGAHVGHKLALWSHFCFQKQN